MYFDQNCFVGNIRNKSAAHLEYQTPDQQNLVEKKQENIDLGEQELGQGDEDKAKHDDVPLDGDDVSVHIDAKVEGDNDGVDDTRQEGEFSEDFEGIGANMRKYSSENGHKKKEDEEDIEQKETEGDRAGEKMDNVQVEVQERESFDEERQAGYDERQTQGEENHSDEMDNNVNEEEHINEDENEEEEKRDPFEFDDSFDDPLYVPPKRRAPLPSSAKKRPPPTCPRKQPESSKGTLPEQVNTRAESVDVVQKRPKIDPKVLEFFVHRFAKAKGKNLATDVLPLSFFNELVSVYGAVPGGAKLAPYTSGEI